MIEILNMALVGFVETAKIIGNIVAGTVELGVEVIKGSVEIVKEMDD